jgi:hypothetical protein
MQQVRLELTTYSLGNYCSIQVSYCCKTSLIIRGARQSCNIDQVASLNNFVQIDKNYKKIRLVSPRRVHHGLM